MLGAVNKAAVYGACALMLAAAGACASTSEAMPQPVAAAQPRGPVLHYHFRALDGREVSSDKALGRNTVVAIVATYDLASQAQARFLSAITHNHVPRTNTYAVVVEPQESRPLVEAFVSTLGLTYPVALVPPETFRKSVFGRAKGLPSVIVFDRGGHLAWHKDGLATQADIERALAELEKD